MKGTTKIAVFVAAVATIAVLAVLVSFPAKITEDLPDKEANPEEITPEIQEKLDEIKKKSEENDYEPLPREWITSGPFQIDRSKYALGEKIFVVIGELDYNEKGQIAFMRPLNDTHYSVYQTIPFDGAEKNKFNYYIQPQLSGSKGICSVDDIVGKWAVVFRGTTYANLNFEITEQIIPGDEDSYEPVC